MKEKACFLLMAAILCASVCACTDREADSYTSAVRLHVVANSDSDEDQQVKYQVRDALIEAYASRLGQMECADDAWRALGQLQAEMAEFARETLASNGFDYTAQVTLATETFPTRNYMGRVWPGGDYRAVRVILGDGDGANWWCVMYPPLCIAQSHGEEVDLDKYKDEIEALSRDDKPPETPVRSFIADKLGLADTWNETFARWTRRLTK